MNNYSKVMNNCSKLMNDSFHIRISLRFVGVRRLRCWACR